MVHCVCMSDNNFRKPSRRIFVFAHPVYLQVIRVKFVYDGHRIKVKVTGAENVRNIYSCNINFYRP